MLVKGEDLPFRKGPHRTGLDQITRPVNTEAKEVDGTMFKQQAFHEEEAHAFFDTLYILDGEHRIELRWKPSGESGNMRRRFYGSKHEALQAALALKDDHDVYAGVAPRRGRGTKEGVTLLSALWADLDAKGDHTPKSRIQQLNDLPYPPSMTVWSGGGFHPYWLLEETIEGSYQLDQAERVMERIAEGLDGDPVHDRSRILRPPGTLNHKGNKPRPVRLVQCDPYKRYTFSQLQEMSDGLPKKRVNGGGGGKVRQDVLGGPIRSGCRNAALTSVAGSLRNRGLDEASILVVLLEMNNLRCEPPLEEAEVAKIARSIASYPRGSYLYLSPAEPTRQRSKVYARRQGGVFIG